MINIGSNRSILGKREREKEEGRCDDREVECDCLENNIGVKPTWVQIPLTLKKGGVKNGPKNSNIKRED